MSEQNLAPKFKPNELANKLFIVLSPVFSIIAAVIVGALLMMLFERNPIEAYRALIRGSFGSSFAIANTVTKAIPLIFTGLSVAIGFKAGLFNIGGEGQLVIGALVAAYFGPISGLHSWFHILAILLLSGLGGIIWAVPPAVFKIKTGAHEVITTLMMSYIAIPFSELILRKYLKDPFSSSGASKEVAFTAKLPTIGNLLPFVPEAIFDISISIFIPIIAALAIWLLLNKTWLGFEIRVFGHNPDAAEHHGIIPGRVILLSLLLGGILAGMAGGIQIMAIQHKLYARSNIGLGFAGIAVALLANNNPLWIIPSAILFGALNSGAAQMQLTANTPVELAEAIQGTIVFFIATQSYIRFRVRGWGGG